MDGKNVVITGATNGVGKSSALGLASLGANIFFIARNEELAKDLMTKLLEINPKGTHYYWKADLASLSQVRSAVEKLRSHLNEVHILFNNAGVLNFRRRVTEDGYELTFAVNHLSHFLLTNLLIDKLKKPNFARIINTSSTAHYNGNIIFDDLHAEESYSMMGRYEMSKLANVLFTYKLVRELQESNITSIVWHPGLVASNLATNNGLIFKFGMKIIRPFQISSKRSAQVLIQLVTNEKYKSSSMKYYRYYQRYPFAPPKVLETKSAPHSYDESLQDRLWEVSKEITGI